MATQTKKTKISSQAVMGEIKTLAMLTGGVVIGSLGGKMIDKVLNVDATAILITDGVLTRYYDFDGKYTGKNTKN
jgi:hypothetical protein